MTVNVNDLLLPVDTSVMPVYHTTSDESVPNIQDQTLTHISFDLSDLITTPDIDVNIMTLAEDNVAAVVPESVKEEEYTTLSCEEVDALIEWTQNTSNTALKSEDSEEFSDHSYSTVVQATRKRKSSEPLEKRVSAAKRKMTTESFEEEQVGTTTDERLCKYLERRRKNNIASKRSRETRKMKILEMDEEADLLEEENKGLRDRIEHLDVLVRQMKEALSARLAKA